MSANDTRVLVETAEAFWNAWSTGQPQEVMSYWDGADPSSSYTPASRPGRLVGAEQIGRYVSETMGDHWRMTVDPTVVHPRRLADNLGSLFAVLEWRFEQRNRNPLAGTLRISAVLRRPKDQWKICHYAEAPLAPLVELRQFYQTVARDFSERP